jgi:Mce-associated membrane protein
MSHNQTSEAVVDNNIRPRSSEVDDDIGELLAEATTTTPRPRWRSILARSRWPRRKLSAGPETPSRATPDADTLEAAPPEQDAAQPDELGDDSSRRARRRALARTVAFVVLPVLAMAVAAGVGYLKYVNAVGAASEQASIQSVQVAKDSTIAMLSYTPATVDKQLSAATDRMTGSFRQSYSTLIHDVVIPGAKDKKISAVATVPATASTSATPNHAVVLVCVDQAITMDDAAPTQTNSVVQITLDRVDNRWLISAFDPK